MYVGLKQPRGDGERYVTPARAAAKETSRCWVSCGFNGRNATHQVDFFPTSTIHSNSNSSTVFCFTEQNSNSVSFSQSQCCRLLKVLSSGFSSEVDVVLGEVVYHKFQAHHY